MAPSIPHLWTLTLFLGITLVFFVASAETGPEAGQGGRNSQDNSYMQQARYVGTEVCKGCHFIKYENWTRTHNHDELQQITESLILGDFTTNLTLSQPSEHIPAVTLDLEHQVGTDLFRVTMGGHTYTIDMVLGSGLWTQRYLIELENSTYILPMQWNISTSEWAPYQLQDWFDTDGEPLVYDWGFGGDPLHQVDLDRSWQKNCAGCHTTHFVPLRNENGEWVDNFSEADIGCEACHGPGSSHVTASDEEKNQYIWKSSDSQICAQCHVQGSSLDGEHDFPAGMLPGDELTDHYELATDIYWADGVTAREHRTQYQDWLSSTHARRPTVSLNRAPCVNCHTAEGAKAHFAGETLTSVPAEATWQITCVACHDPHSSEYEYDLRAPEHELCVTCHNAEADVFVGIAHFPRYDLMMGQGGQGLIGELQMGGVATCADCHLPNVGAQFLEWEVASHTFEPILPQEALRYDMPGSCTSGCHNGAGPGHFMDTATAGEVVKTWSQVIDEMVDQAGDNLSRAQGALELAREQGTDSEVVSDMQTLYDTARYNFDFIAQESSHGMHNFNYARDLLFDSQLKAQEVQNTLAVLEDRPPVVMAGEPQMVYQGDTVSFNASASYDPEGTTLSFDWDFDDGNTSRGALVEHVFGQRGIYRVQLIVTDGTGQQTRSEVMVVVLDRQARGMDELDQKTEALDRELARKADTDELQGKATTAAMLVVLLIALVCTASAYLATQQALLKLKDEMRFRHAEAPVSEGGTEPASGPTVMERSPEK